MRSSCALATFAALMVLSGACSDLSTPADLDREQILAVRATPRVLLPGGSVVLDTLVSGPNGPLVGIESYQLSIDVPGVSVATTPSGQTLLSCVDGLVVEQAIELDLSIELPDGQVLLAQKSVAVDNRDVDNPHIGALLVNGAATEPGQVVRESLGDIAIAVESESATSVAWYTSIGEIRYYRSAETTIELAEEDVGEGWVAVVVRDDEGGVSWQSFQLEAGL